MSLLNSVSFTSDLLSLFKIVLKKSNGMMLIKKYLAWRISNPLAFSLSNNPFFVYLVVYLVLCPAIASPLSQSYI